MEKVDEALRRVARARTELLEAERLIEQDNAGHGNVATLQAGLDIFSALWFIDEAEVQVAMSTLDDEIDCLS